MMGSTGWKFKTKADMWKAEAILSDYFRKEFTEENMKKVGWPKEYWTSLKLEDAIGIHETDGLVHVFLVNSKSWFKPFWIVRKDKALWTKDGYCNEKEIIDYLKRNGIRFAKWG